MRCRSYFQFCEVKTIYSPHSIYDIKYLIGYILGDIYTLYMIYVFCLCLCNKTRFA